MTFVRESIGVRFFNNINCKVTVRSDQPKELGLILDRGPSFAPHILYVTNAAMYLLGFVVRDTFQHTYNQATIFLLNPVLS